MEGGELFDRIVKKSYYNEKEARDVKGRQGEVKGRNGEVKER